MNKLLKYLVHKPANLFFIAEVPGAGVNSMMSVLAEKAIVKKEELWDVVGTNQWKINNALDNEYEPRPVHLIVREACALVNANLPYCVFRGNCEHFANELRYGKAESRQVSGHILVSTCKTLTVAWVKTGNRKGYTLDTVCSQWSPS